MSENITSAMPDYRGLVFVLLGTNSSLLAVGTELSLSVISLVATAAVCWPGRERSRASWTSRFALAVLVGILVMPHLLIHDAVIALLPGFLLWRASAPDDRQPVQGRRHLLRWTLALGPAAFFLMQFWHPPVVQIGAWYVMVLVGVVLWSWKALQDRPPERESGGSAVGV